MFDVLPVFVEQVGAPGLLLILVAAVLGGVAQGTVGFGAAFATVPALAIVAPEVLPGTMLVAAFPLTVVMSLLERSSADRPAVRRLLVSRFPGIVLGTVIVAVMDVRWLTLVVALVLLGAVGASAYGWSVSVTPGREYAAGVVSGVTGAATALGGPPLALLYRDREPEVMRPTLAQVWVIGILLTLASLAVAGSFTWDQAILGAALAAVVLAGLAVSRLVVARTSSARIRAAVLWWAGLGGIAALVRVLAG